MPTVNYAWSSVNGSFDFNSNYTTGSQDYAAVTSVNGGSKYFGVFFTPDGIVGRFFDNLGNALGGDFQVNLTFSGVQTDASVTQLTNGNIIVTYTDYSVDAGGDILARIVSSSGTLGAELPITTSTSDDSDSDITALSDGGFAVSWTDVFSGGDLDLRGTGRVPLR